MRKYILLGALLFSTPALSEDAKTYQLTVTQAELGTLAQALGERPYKEVASLLMKLDAQLRIQNTPPAPEKPKDEQKQPDKPADAPK